MLINSLKKISDNVYTISLSDSTSRTNVNNTTRRSSSDTPPMYRNDDTNRNNVATTEFDLPPTYDEAIKIVQISSQSTITPMTPSATSVQPSTTTTPISTTTTPPPPQPQRSDVSEI